MPAKGPRDEKKWQEAKQQAAKSKGKSVSELKGDDYGLVMHIYKQKDPDVFKNKKGARQDAGLLTLLSSKMASDTEFRESLLAELRKFTK